MATLTSCRVLLTLLLVGATLETRAWGDEVDEYVSAFIQKLNIPGLSVAVVRDGTLVKAAGYGFANLELASPAAPETAYEIGSITKQFTAEAVMLLVQDGKLGLDDPLRLYLDGLPAAWQTLTLRQLLTHTSGLKDWEAAGLLSFRREYTPAEFINVLSPFALDFSPGERWSYSNTGYVLLGMVVARASGQSYEDFVAKRIFEPLGLRATRFSHPQEIVPHRASGYVEENGRLRKGELLRPRLLAPNGGVLTSVLDLARWERVFRSETLLRQSSLEQMLAPVTLRDGQTSPAAFGIFVDRSPGHRALVHNGSTPGGFSSVFYHYLDDKLTVIVLCNIDRDDAVNRVATWVAGVFVPGLNLSTPP